MPETNGAAYFAAASLTEKKSFKTSTSPGYGTSWAQPGGFVRHLWPEVLLEDRPVDRDTDAPLGVDAMKPFFPFVSDEEAK